MSLNDLFNSDIVLPVIIVICLIAFLGIPFIISWQEKEVYNRTDNTSKVTKISATILDIKTTNNYLTHNIVVNTVVFEFPSGQRIELAVKDTSTMIKGDSGILRYQGKKFLSFERNI